MLLRCENPNYGCWQSFDSQAHLVVCRKHLRLWLIPTTGNTSNILSRLSGDEPGLCFVSVFGGITLRSYPQSHDKYPELQTDLLGREVATLTVCRTCSVSDLWYLRSECTFNEELIFSMVQMWQWHGRKAWETRCSKDERRQKHCCQCENKWWHWGQLVVHEKQWKACKYFLKILYFCWCFMKHTFISISIFMPHLTSDWWD